MRRQRRASQDYRDFMLSTNPVAYWRLGEASGSVARDEMGVNHGTYVGSPLLGVAGLLSGDPNTAATFDGTTQYVSGTVPETGSNFTVAAWGRTISTAIADLISRRAANPNVAFDLILVPPSIRLYIGDGTQSASVSTTLSDNDGAQHLWVGTFNGSLMRIYRDGVLANSATLSIVPSAIGASFYIGNDSYGRRWPGTIDEPAVWNRDITPAEIAELYRIGMGR